MLPWRLSAYPRHCLDWRRRQTLWWSCDGRWRQRLSRVASAGLWALAAIDAEPRLLIDRETHLSWLSVARELSVPRLSRNGRWGRRASEASDAGNSAIGFFGWAGHVAASSALDAGVPRLSVGIPASVTRDFQPSDGITAIFICGAINRSGG
jgi:hypothetical protein